MQLHYDITDIYSNGILRVFGKKVRIQKQDLTSILVRDIVRGGG
jgi:hypothetical protein